MTAIERCVMAGDSCENAGPDDHTEDYCCLTLSRSGTCSCPEREQNIGS